MPWLASVFVKTTYHGGEIELIKRVSWIIKRESNIHTAPRVEWTGLASFARCNKTCDFRKLIQIFFFKKMHNTTFLCNRFPPPILSTLHSIRGIWDSAVWIRRTRQKLNKARVTARTYWLIWIWIMINIYKLPSFFVRVAILPCLCILCAIFKALFMSPPLLVACAFKRLLLLQDWIHLIIHAHNT